MSELTEFIKEFNKNNPSPCWKSPNNEMYIWAKEWEASGRYSHGLGNLDQPCEPKPGQTCPACGIEWK